MEARIIGTEEDLGDVRGGLSFFGNTLTRDWSDIDVSDDQLAKLKANRFVQVRGRTKSEADDQQELADAEEMRTIKGRLDELGADYGAKASLSTLRSKLDAAEKAHASAQQDAEKAADEAAAAAEAASVKPTE